MKETIEFETVHDIEGAAIAIERTPDFFQVAQQLSEVIYGLPLDQLTNDRLVALMVDQVQQAEKGLFSMAFEWAWRSKNTSRTHILPGKLQASCRQVNLYIVRYLFGWRAFLFSNTPPACWWRLEGRLWRT
jgi:phospholipid N-methyltransferase